MSSPPVSPRWRWNRTSACSRNQVERSNTLAMHPWSGMSPSPYGLKSSMKLSSFSHVGAFGGAT